ncbi:peptide chain release factor 2 [bacterium]|nr:peptide chain release factor 2 [bacterium]
MANNDLTTRLAEMKNAIAALSQQLTIPEKIQQITTLEELSLTADFWNNPDQAQKTMQLIARLKAEVDPWRSIGTRIQDALELADLSDTDDLIEELSSEVSALETSVEKLSLQAMLSGTYDRENAILAIHAGAGGTESQDWALMLERMYLRWIADNGYKVDIIERSDGEEAGIKSVMMSIQGAFAFGWLRSEAGVHRLVRISPFDASSRRHTSFAKIELWPDIQGEINVEINEKDLRIDTYRSSGAGGQNVQKNDTAVRLTHLPTGIVVQCQNERSQVQNRERALQILKARLFEMEPEKQEAELAALKGDNVDAGWGNQIRSYVLHPYQMVKDHRTDHETGNTGAVLDGRLNEFMEAYLRTNIESRAAG